MSDKKDSPPAPASASADASTSKKDTPDAAGDKAGVKPAAAPPPRPAPKPPTPPAPPRPPARPPSPPPPRRRGKTAGLALVLALLALIAVAVAGWQIWRMQRSRDTGAQQVHMLSQQVNAMQHTLQNVAQQRQALSDHLHKINDANQDLREQIAAVSQRADQQQGAVTSLLQRTNHLEGAVASLSRRAGSGHEKLLLNQTELLLRMGKARYQLFHDADGAAKAYALAAQTLGQLDDPTYAGVRQSIVSEHRALLNAQPQQRADRLQQLGAWRTRSMHWPLRTDATSATSRPKGFWDRAWHALSKVVRVHHDRGAPLAAADAHLARELVALDMAQAQAALLADDAAGFRHALQRADTMLGRDFDTHDATVQAVRSKLQAWIKAKPAATPDLGAALHKLSNLRSVDAADETAPAAASSAGGGSP